MPGPVRGLWPPLVPGPGPVLVLVRAKPLSGYMVLVLGIALLFQVEHGMAVLGL